MTFGERLREARQRIGMTQEDLAAELDITQGAIGRYENAGGEPDHAKLIKLPKILGVSLEWLVGLDDSDIKVHGRARKKQSGMALVNKISGSIEDGTLTEEQINLLYGMVNEFVGVNTRRAASTDDQS